MVLDLLQAGVRTAYRAMGAKEVTHRTGRSKLHAFRFAGGERGTLILLHGLGDASTTWFRKVRTLRERYEIWAIDLPPFGLSQLDDEPYLSPEDQAHEVAHLLDAEDLQDLAVVGQSMGGWTVPYLLEQARDRVLDAVLISPAGAPLPGSLRARELMQPTTSEDVMALWNAMWYKPPAVAKALARSAVKRFQRPEVRGFLASMGGRQLLDGERLAKIDTPGLVIWGKEDRILDASTPAWLARHWGGPLDRTYLARCAHLAHLERPAAVLSRLEGFLEQRR